MNSLNFSFIDEFIAGSAKPYHMTDIDMYRNAGITDVISLTPEKPLVMKYVDDLAHHHIPIYSIPNQSQIDQFISILNNIKKSGGKAVIHCQFGQERTGIFLAIYLIKVKRLNVHDAIAMVRQLRPKSLRSAPAIQFLLDNFS